MYEALISTKLMDALEITPLTKAAKNRLDAAYLRGLRQIMDMKTTIGQKKDGEEKTNTNQKVLEEASKAMTSGRIEERAERKKAKEAAQGITGPIRFEHEEK